MDFESLYSFLMVARTKSISKAAKQMHVTQPTLSARIRKLEEGLGFSLIERNWEGVRLTEKGRYFLPYVAQFLQDFSNALTVCHEFKVSYKEVIDIKKIYIGIDSWLVPLFVQHILAEFQYDPEIEFKILSLPTETIITLIENEAVMIGIFYTEEQKSVFNSLPLIEDKMVLLYCSNNSFKIENDLSNISLLKNKPFLLFDNPVLVYHSNITSQIIQQLEIAKFHIIDDMNVMINLVAGDYGYTIIPKSSITQFFDQIHQGRIPVRLVDIGTNKIPKIHIQIAYLKANGASIPVEKISYNVYRRVVDFKQTMKKNE